MCLDDGFHQAQAKAEPSFRAARIATKETVEDTRQFVRRDTRPGVVHAQHRGAFFAAHLFAPAAAIH